MKEYPEGKFLSTVKVGAKGQIVIPREVREMFGLEEGSSLVLMADRGQGIALQPYSYMETFFNAVNAMKGKNE